jgi:hypothetical protein
LNILNVISLKEIEDRFSKLCEENEDINKLAETYKVKSYKLILDNWNPETKDVILEKLSLVENPEFDNVYHEKN